MPNAMHYKHLYNKYTVICNVVQYQIANELNIIYT